MKIKDVTDIISNFAPANLAESYDNVGLLVGDASQDATGALLCLDVTPQIVEEAVDKGCNLIISHHPLIFGGIKRLTGSSDSQQAVISAIKNNIAIYAAHTNIDNVSGGVNYRIGELLGLVNMTPLVPVTNGSDNGAGVVGELENSTPVEELLLEMKKKFGCGVIRHSSLVVSEVNRVAVCGGSGAEFITAAGACGAQLYITADVKYHNFFDLPKGLVIADIGHYESEKFTIDIFYEKISKKMPTFAVCKTELISNPVIYL